MAMSLKQKLHFGSKRVRAAARASLKAKRKTKRAAAHRTRSKPNPARKRRATVRKQARRRTRRSNPGEIISLVLGNPSAKRSSKKMAKAKRSKTRRATSRANSAGRRRTRRANPATRRHARRRSNPAGFRMSELLVLGAGAVAGASVPKIASQAVLGAKNTGAMGYVANLAGTGLLAWAADKFLPRQRAFAVGILAGGIGQVIGRIIADYTQFGSFVNQLGMGDYMASNFVAPQILPNALESAMSSNGVQAPVVVASNAAMPAGLSGVSAWG